MSNIINNLFALCILIFIVSLFADPVDVARDMGAALGNVAEAFYEGLVEG